MTARERILNAFKPEDASEFGDQISPRMFSDLNFSLLQECVKEIKGCGLKSIYYYCGDLNDRLDAILEAGADAVHFEESKKAFSVDLEQIAIKVQGRCVLFSNLDSISILQNGSEDQLRSEIQRQMRAGRVNGNRIVISTGSPITLGTSVERVKLFTDLVRENSSRW